MPKVLPHCTFESFDPCFQDESAGAIQAAQEYTDGQQFVPVLTFWGGVGSGKSHLLQAIGWELLGRGVQVRYVFILDFLAELRSSFSENADIPYHVIYRQLEDAQVLLLDDMGAEKASLWTQEIHFRLVDRAWRDSMPMVVSTNCGEGMADRIDKLGRRTADRLFDTGSGRVKVVATGAKSYRTGR